MNFIEAEMLLKEHEQLQILDGFEDLAASQQQELLDQIANIDWDVIALAKEHKAVERGELAPLGAVEVQEIKSKEDEFKAAGVEAIRQGKIGAVLLAGGMGTRLGLEIPKGAMDIGETKELYIFECLVNNMMDVVKETGTFFPLYIMTSDKNHDDTVSFFTEHNYFGYDSSFVKFFRQDMAAAVDYDGKLLKEAPGKLATSPNGNGGWFTSMAKAGLLTDVHRKNIQWLNIFAVDNVLQRIADPVFVGATLLSGYEAGGKVIRKAFPEEKLGVLCQEDGQPSIVEYYEMTDDMVNLRDDKGDLLYNFGVTLNYLFKVEKLEEIMKNHMPVHIVEKKIPYITADGTYVKPEEPNGYKFETLVVDMIRMMDHCLPFEVIREKEFAPIKNLHGVDSLDTARELMKKNNVTL